METFTIISVCINIIILIVTVYYIAHAPVNAVRIGRDLNTEQQKDNAKRNLFLTLFSLRGSPVHYDFVRGLHEIDVVFEDTSAVLAAWHKLYDSYQISGQTNENQIWELLRVELLSAMAVSLGYNQIKQTDIVRQYSPEGHGNLKRMEWEFREAELAFYKSSTAMAHRIMDRFDAQDESTETQEPEVVSP